jgi:hypothetical protein
MSSPYHALLRKQKAERLEFVRRALVANDGNVGATARQIGVSPNAIEEARDLHGWEVPRLRRGRPKKEATWSWKDVCDDE